MLKSTVLLCYQDSKGYRFVQNIIKPFNIRNTCLRKVSELKLTDFTRFVFRIFTANFLLLV